MKRNKKIRKGFTLMEIIIVIVIMSILVGLSYPKFSGYIKESKVISLHRDLDTLQKVINEYDLVNKKYLIEDKEIIPTDHFEKYLETKGDLGKFFEIDLNLLKGNITELKNKGQYLYSKGTKKIYYSNGIEDKNGIRIYEINKKEGFLTLQWLLNSNMIVTDNSIPQLKNAPIGSVLWNYNDDTKEFYNFSNNIRVSMLSVNTTVDSLLDAYYSTGNEYYLTRAKVVGEYILNNTFEGTVYGKELSFVVSMRQSNNNWVENYDEVYIQDIAHTSYISLRLFQATKDIRYKNNGIKLLETLNYTQDLSKNNTELPEEIRGNLFLMYVHQGGKRFSPTWNNVGLDNVDMIVNAYKTRLQTYKTSLLSILQNHGGINSYGIVYENYADLGAGWKAQNYDQLTGRWGTNEAFTTDQYFYCILGVAKLDKTLGTQLLDKAKTLQENNLFYGQYNVDGTMNYPVYEIINTALYLELSKYLNAKGDYKDIENTLIENTYKSDNTDKNSYGGYTWGVNSGDNVLETIATSRIASSLLK